MRTLILLTSSFPYDSGEEFLSAEVNYIKGFDKIIICPCSIKKNSSITHTIPQNILCIPVQRTSLGKLSYLKILSKAFIREEIWELLQNKTFSIGRLHELLYFAKNAVEIFNCLKTISPLNSSDDVVIYSYWLYDAALAGVLLGRCLRKKGVHVSQISRAHGFDIHPERAKYSYLPLRRYLLNDINRIYPCSKNGAETIRRMFPEYADKIQPFYLGTTDYGLHVGSREQVFHVVSCSYMVPVKRLHLIIEALKNADFAVRWTHIGSGLLEKEICSLAQQLPSNVQVELLGQMSNTAIMHYYQTNEVSVFINVSSSEGIPVSVMEACSFGIPVIATDVGGTAEAVWDGENGFLLEKDFDTGQLLDKLRMVKDLPDTEYETLCKYARKHWEENFNASNNYRKFYRMIGGLKE